MILKNGKRIDGCSDTVPIGTVNPFLGTVAPFGYLLLQGQKVSKTTYPELYAICGTTFGPETSTEFTLPDLRGQTIAGYKEGDSVFGTLGGLIGNKSISYTPTGVNTGGAVGNHTLTANESGLPKHKHSMRWDGGNIGSGSTFWYLHREGGSNECYTSEEGGTSASTGHNHGFTQPTFTGTQTELDVVQPTVTLNWIVKAVMLIPNQSTVVNTDNNSTVNVYSCDFINDMLEQMKQEAFDFAHPVGSYYETSDSTWSPQAAGWYGTWVADNDGSALVSYKSSGAFNKATGTIVGGESQSYTPAGKNTGTAVTMNAVELTHSGGAVQSHTLTVDEMPSHIHDVFVNGQGSGGRSGLYMTWGYSENADIKVYNGQSFVAQEGSGKGHNHGFTQPNKHSFTPTTKTVTQPTFTGTAATLSTIQTSKVVYRWHRTA